MKKIFYILIPIFLFFFLISPVNADTHNVVDGSGNPSCEQVDVQNAINSASDGDTIQLPEKTCAWTTLPYEKYAKPSVIINQKAIILKGAGIDKTVIIDNTDVATNAIPIRVDSIEGKAFRITGMTIKGPTLATVQTSDSYGGIISIYGNSKNWRIDHIKFDDNYTRAIYTAGENFGVIDNCNCIKYNHSQCFNIATSGFSEAVESWKKPLSFGTAEAVYMEENTVLRGNDSSYIAGMVDGNWGSRYVVRYNDVTNSTIFYHGPEVGANRGGFSMEVYKNKITYTYNSWNPLIDVWSGTAVIYDNEFISNGTMANSLGVKYRRTCSAYGRFDYGVCDGTNSNDGNENIPVTKGYPCLDQPGRSTDYSASQIHPQTLEPLYEWNNIIKHPNGTTANPDFTVKNYCADEALYIQKDRDFFNDTPRPGYTPYIYPHPLRTDCVNNPITCDQPTQICQLGDIDCNNQINITDIQLAINIYLGTNTDQKQKIRADLNSDDNVNIIDIQRIINLLLGEQK